jgi:hypothetical protein
MEILANMKTKADNLAQLERDNKQLSARIIAIRRTMRTTSAAVDEAFARTAELMAEREAGKMIDITEWAALKRTVLKGIKKLRAVRAM